MGLFPCGWKVPTPIGGIEDAMKICDDGVGHELEGFGGDPVGAGGFFWV